MPSKVTIMVRLQEDGYSVTFVTHDIDTDDSTVLQIEDLGRLGKDRQMIMITG